MAVLRFENVMAVALRAYGLTVLQNGWPDFLVADDAGHFVLLEAKGPRDVFRRSQEQMFKTLQQLGVPAAIAPSIEDALLACRKYKLKLTRARLKPVPIDLLKREKHLHGGQGKRIWATYSNGQLHVPIEEPDLRKAVARLIEEKRTGLIPMNHIASRVRKDIRSLAGYGKLRGRPPGSAPVRLRKVAREVDLGLRPKQKF